MTDEPEPGTFEWLCWYVKERAARPSELFKALSESPEGTRDV